MHPDKCWWVRPSAWKAAGGRCHALFVAIDRAVHADDADRSEASSVDFLNRLEGMAPMKISQLLTDNNSQFTDRFTSKKSVREAGL
jgi:hypothetical protein